MTCVRGDGKGRAAARAHRGLSLDGEWGERESSQARVPVMRDDIDSWSRPRLAERLKVVGLRAHVAGDARPQLTRRDEDLRRQYESDMRKMIDLKLQCAEAVSRASDLEEALQKRR